MVSFWISTINQEKAHVTYPFIVFAGSFRLLAVGIEGSLQLYKVAQHMVSFKISNTLEKETRATYSFIVFVPAGKSREPGVFSLKDIGIEESLQLCKMAQHVVSFCIPNIIPWNRKHA